MKNILISDDLLSSHGILEITINRPKVLNSLDTETLREIVNTLHDHKDFAKVVVITGSEKSFSAGADISQMVNQSPVDQIKDDREFLWKEFNAYPFPIIAAVNGVAMGGGMEIALACDLIIASSNARFALPEPKVGLAALAGGMQRLPRQIGMKNAMGMMLTGRHVEAAEAKELGIVNEVVESQSDLMDRARDWAKQIEACSPMSIRATKQVAYDSLNEASLEASMSAQYTAVHDLFTSEDFIEGPVAFAEKRAPNWKGK